MKTLYIECNMGAAGDMLMSALLELHKDPDDFLLRLNSANIPKVKFERIKAVTCGIYGTHIRVSVDGIEECEQIHNHEHNHEHNYEHNHEHNHEHKHAHHHSSLKDIEHIVSRINISEKVRKDVMAVYNIIAEAESKAHNCNIEDIHFHEVGTLDAVADITGVCMLIDELGVDKILASPINTGKGSVQCAHGILPVPAPATAYILRDVPTYNNEVDGELCTPTGAALLKYFVSEFNTMPIMKTEQIGYGIGTKKFATANCVRAFIGETEDNTDKVAELSCNIDDMSGEAVAYAVSKLFSAGALDVYTTSVSMKKNRMGILLSCVCKLEDKEKLIAQIFKHTTTIGIRENLFKRYTLSRKIKTVETEYGQVRVKYSEGYGVKKQKAEFDDLEKIANKNDISLSQIKF